MVLQVKQTSNDCLLTSAYYWLKFVVEMTIKSDCGRRLFMTANQINFARLQEDRRHNVVSEKETAKHNRAQESIGYGGLAESVRHNTATESINWYTAEGLVNLQSAQADKAISETGVLSSQAEETHRHNVVTESQSGSSIQETHRHNVATEENTAYANRTQRGEAWTEGFRDVSSALFGNKGVVGGIMSLVPSNNTTPVKGKWSNAVSGAKPKGK